jgi:hypothetical protein
MMTSDFGRLLRSGVHRVAVFAFGASIFDRDREKATSP